jgi:hypothetical protein
LGEERRGLLGFLRSRKTVVLKKPLVGRFSSESASNGPVLIYKREHMMYPHDVEEEVNRLERLLERAGFVSIDVKDLRIGRRHTLISSGGIVCIYENDTREMGVSIPLDGGYLTMEPLSVYVVALGFERIPL